MAGGRVDRGLYGEGYVLRARMWLEVGETSEVARMWLGV